MKILTSSESWWEFNHFNGQTRTKVATLNTRLFRFYVNLFHINCVWIEAIQYLSFDIYI
jgi:hypothetical protein